MQYWIMPQFDPKHYPKNTLEWSNIDSEDIVLERYCQNTKFSIFYEPPDCIYSGCRFIYSGSPPQQF